MSEHRWSTIALTGVVLAAVIAAAYLMLQPIYDEINEQYGTNEKPGD